MELRQKRNQLWALWHSVIVKTHKDVIDFVEGYWKIKEDEDCWQFGWVSVMKLPNYGFEAKLFRILMVVLGKIERLIVYSWVVYSGSDEGRWSLQRSMEHCGRNRIQWADSGIEVCFWKLLHGKWKRRMIVKCRNWARQDRLAGLKSEEKKSYLYCVELMQILLAFSVEYLCSCHPRWALWQKKAV